MQVRKMLIFLNFSNQFSSKLRWPDYNSLGPRLVEMMVFGNRWSVSCCSYSNWLHSAMEVGFATTTEHWQTFHEIVSQYKPLSFHFQHSETI